jgi:hypothetical protein
VLLDDRGKLLGAIGSQQCPHRVEGWRRVGRWLDRRRRDDMVFDAVRCGRWRNRRLHRCRPAARAMAA